MVKQLVTKRKNKDLTASEFWEYKDRLSKPKPLPIHTFVDEEEVLNRHKFKKHKDQVKAFDPLQSLNEKVLPPTKTYTFDLMDKLQTMPKQLTGLRSKCLTHALIRNNLKQIFNILFKNLELDDSWDFIVTILRDTEQESFEHILIRLEALSTMEYDGFNDKIFRHIFTVISTFYETSQQKIKDKIELVWKYFSKSLFNHHNKYMRRFSASSFRYILDRLEQDSYKSFVQTLTSQQLFDNDKQAISQALFSQFRFINRFLTKQSIYKLNMMWSVLPNDFISAILIKLVNHMSYKVNKFQQIFDLVQLSFSVVLKFKQNPQCSTQYFLTLFARHPDIRNNPKVKQIFNDLMSSFFQKSLLDNSPQFINLVGTSVILNNHMNDHQFNYLKQLPLSQKSIFLQLLKSHKCNFSQQFIQPIVLLFTPQLKQFISDNTHLNQIYSLLILLQTHSFSAKLNLQIPSKSLQRLNIKEYQKSFVMIKLLQYIELSGQNKTALKSILLNIDNQLNTNIKDYCKSLSIDVFMTFTDQFPILNRIRLFKEETMKLAQCIGVHNLSKQLFGHDDIKSKLMVLRNRVREQRYNALENLQDFMSEQLYQTLRTIDSEDVDVQNERITKLTLINLISQQISDNNIEVIGNWCLGFAFTGFNEITDGFVDFFGKFLLTNANKNSTFIIEFLKLMNFRMSRTFKNVIEEFNLQREKKFKNIQDQKFLKLLQEDHPLFRNQAIERVGYQRVTKTLSKYPKVKEIISKDLNQIVKKYFQEDFYRDKNDIQACKNSGQFPQQLPLKQPGPHPHHLSAILNLITTSYLPPYDCLHYSEDLCSILQSKGLKKKSWQKQWHKKDKVVEFASDLFNLPKQQHQIYLHFLWRLILSSAEKDRDRIFDHLNQTDLDLDYLLNIHYGQLYLTEKQVQQMDSQDLNYHLALLQQFKLLSFQQRTKSFVTALKSKMSPHLSTLTKLVLQIIKLSQDSSIQTTANYKNISKQSIKTLLLIFDSDQNDVIQKVIFQIFKSFKQKITNLKSFVVSGIPGVLRIIETLSQKQELSHLFTSDVIESISSCYDNEMLYPDALKAINTTFISLLQQQNIIKPIKENSSNIMNYLYKTISCIRLQQDEIKIVGYLSEYAKQIPETFIELFVIQIQKTLKNKKKALINKERRSQLLSTLFLLSAKSQNNLAIKKLIQFIPELESQQQQQLRNIACNSFPSSSKVINIIENITATVTKGLVTEPDYDRVFSGINSLKQTMGQFNSEEKQYIVFNVLNLGRNSQLGVKNGFIEITKVFMEKLNIQNKQQFNLLRRVTKTLLGIMASSTKNDDVFCIYIKAMNEVLTNIKTRGIYIGEINKQVLQLIHIDPQQNFFELVSALSQSKKLNALNKVLKSKILNWSIPQQRLQFPNLILKLLLPILQHMIYRKDPTGNLSSTLNLISTQIYGLLFRCVQPSQIKQNLKKLIHNIKFQQQTATNYIIVQIISSILDNIQINANCLPELMVKIKQEGVNVLDIKNDDDYELDDEDNYEAEDEADVEKNYARFDKKLIDTQLNDNGPQDTTSLLLFLRKHILTDLKSLLFYKLKISSSSKKQKQEKSRIFLTVVITKLLKKLSVKTFLVQFHKIVIKLCRLLKSRDDDSRNNARKCLLQVLKITGPGLIYVVVRQLKFQLKQDFQRHVLNYTIHYIVQQLYLSGGQLDISIPLIISCAFQQTIGVLSQQKQLIDASQIPIKLFEMKKKKGLQIFKQISKVISINKISYLLNALKQQFNKHSVSEANNEKFSDIIEHILAGLNKNSTMETHSTVLINLFLSVLQLSAIEIRQDSLTENTIKQQKRHGKVTSKQTYQLQSQAAQGKSIFKKMNNDLKYKKNKNQLDYMIYNFWLSLLQISQKKGIINQQLLKQNQTLKLNISKFIMSCVESIDNKIVGKSLKILQSMIRWKSIKNDVKDRIQNLVIDRFDKLTSGDVTLIKTSFKIILATYQQMKMNTLKLKRLFDYIELSIHDQVLEAYQLFKSIMIKDSNKSQIATFISTIRQKMISSYDDDIRKISKQIFVIFVTKILSSQANLLDQAMNYILTNVEYKQQDSRRTVLDALQNIITWLIANNKATFTYFSSIVFFQLVVAYANESEVDIRQTIAKIQLLVCSNIDKSKVKEYIKHSICWMNENDEALRFNGLNTLNLLAKQFQLMVKSEIKSISKIIGQILEKESNKLRLYLDEEYNLKKREMIISKTSQWNQVFTNTVTSQAVSYCLPACLELIDKLNLTQSKEIQQYIWTLCSHTVKEIHIKCFEISCKSQIDIEQQDQIDESGIKKYTIRLRSNIQSIVKLSTTQSIKYLVQIMTSLLSKQQYDVLQQTLICFRKVLHQYMKRIQNHKTQVKTLTLIFLQMVSNQKLLQTIVLHCQSTLFQITLKFINQQETITNIDSSINDQIEKITNLIKNVMTPGVFYKIISQMKKTQKDMRAAKKARIDQMAVTQTEKYYDIKRGKKGKSKAM